MIGPGGEFEFERTGAVRRIAEQQRQLVASVVAPLAEQQRQLVASLATPLVAAFAEQQRQAVIRYSEQLGSASTETPLPGWVIQGLRFLAAGPDAIRRMESCRSNRSRGTSQAHRDYWPNYDCIAIKSYDYEWVGREFRQLTL